MANPFYDEMPSWGVCTAYFFFYLYVFVFVLIFYIYINWAAFLALNCAIQDDPDD